MTVPRAWVPPETLRSAVAVPSVPLELDGELAHHLGRVLRLGAGDRVQLFDGEGLVAEACILTLGAKQAELAVSKHQQQSRPLTPPLTLMAAELKADRSDWVIQKATELGTDRLVPVTTARSIPRPGASAAERRQKRWRRVAREACRQCRRAWLPELLPRQRLTDALASLEPTAASFLLAEHAAEGTPGLQAALSAAPLDGGVVLLAGPEGGFTDEELARTLEAGFQAVSLGPRILRAETASIAAVTLAAAHIGLLG